MPGQEGAHPYCRLIAKACPLKCDVRRQTFNPETIIDISSAFEALARSDVRNSILRSAQLHIWGVIPAKPA